MGLSLAIVGLLVLALVLYLVRRKGSAAAQRPDPARPAKPDSTSAFHAVSIKFTSNACSAAKSLEGKRFLSGAAPRIPLPDCDVLECKCRFVHHDDRRDGEDRRHPFGSGFGGDTGRYAVEKRQQPDRRKDANQH